MEKLKDIKLNKELLNIEPNEKVLYDAIILQRASLRHELTQQKIVVK